MDEQISSLLQQTYKNIQIYVRDDGSTDTTVDILQRWQSKFPNKINLIKGSNIGIQKSFTQALKMPRSKPEDYFAFCDQDDYWLTDKIEHAVSALNKTKLPSCALYSSTLTYTDERLNPLGKSTTPRYFEFENAIVENSAVGCTTLFGSDLRSRLLASNPENFLMHDWWLYLIATAFGEVIFDIEPRILYRQHFSTATPYEPGIKRTVNRGIEFFRKHLAGKQIGLNSINQAISFKETFLDIPKEKKMLINSLESMRQSRSFIKRIKYVTMMPTKRNSRIETAMLGAMILIGKH